MLKSWPLRSKSKLPYYYCYILQIVDRKVLDRISVFTAPIRSFTITANVYEYFFYTSMVFTTCQMNLLLYAYVDFT